MKQRDSVAVQDEKNVPPLIKGQCDRKHEDNNTKELLIKKQCGKEEKRSERYRFPV